MERVYRRQYAGLADEEVPALGDRTPRELVPDPAGRRKVRAWLEGFNETEREMAAEAGREPVDLGFLWEELGLRRE